MLSCASKRGGRGSGDDWERAGKTSFRPIAFGKTPRARTSAFRTVRSSSCRLVPRFPWKISSDYYHLSKRTPSSGVRRTIAHMLSLRIALITLILSAQVWAQQASPALYDVLTHGARTKGAMPGGAGATAAGAPATGASAA